MTQHIATTTVAADTATAQFLAHRPQLRKLAYQMLGSVSLAEDALQDTWLRWRTIGPEEEIRSSRAWLITTLSRICIDELRRAKLERESYPGPWLPEPFPTDTADDPAAVCELRSDMSMALLLLMERLGAEERIAFLLFDVFGHDYRMVAQVLNKSEDACRQLVHRARRHLQQDRARFPTHKAQRQHMLQEFILALHGNDLSRLLATMAPDICLTSDGGGKVRSAKRPLHGTRAVSRLLLGIRQFQVAGAYPQLREFNAADGIVMLLPDGRVSSAVQFECDDTGRITRIFIVTNPEKLRGLNPEADENAPHIFLSRR